MLTDQIKYLSPLTQSMREQNCHARTNMPQNLKWARENILLEEKTHRNLRVSDRILY